jgi:hypothetical protein
LEKVAEALLGFPGLTHEALLKLDGYGRQPLEPSKLNTGHHSSAVTMAAEGIRRREVVAEGGPLKPTHPIQCASPSCALYLFSAVGMQFQAPCEL